MNKFKVLGLVAATLTLSCGLAACGHKHTFSSEWKSDENQHWHEATCEHSDQKGDLGDHVGTEDGVCDTCGRVLATVVPDGTVGITAQKTTTKYELTAGGLELDVSDLKVYYVKQDSTQNGEVPATDYTIEYYNGTTKLESNKVTEPGIYTISAKVEKAKVGEEIKDIIAEVDVTVIDDIKTDSLKIKDGATLTQAQAPEDNMTSTWKFEIERKSGAKVELSAADVKINNLDTVNIGTQKVAKVIYNETNPEGTALKAELEVKYDITQGELVTKSYAVNFSSYDVGHKFAATGDKLKQGDKEICEVVSNLRATEKPENTKVEVQSSTKEYENKYFTKRIKFGGKSSASDGRWLKFELANTTQITVIFSGNAGRGIRLFKDAYDATDSEASTSGNLVDSAKIEVKDVLYEKKFVVQPGTYLLANWESAETKGGDCNIWYVQIDEFVAKTETAVTLPTDNAEYVDLDVTLDDATVKKTYNVGDAVDKTGISAKAITVQPVTAEKSEKALTADEITLEIDTATAGVGKKATVSYKLGEVTKTFEYTVDVVDASVKNVKEITAALKSGVVTQADEGQKVTIKKTDIEVTTVKVDDTIADAETAAIKSYVVKYGETVIDETTGLEFAIADEPYELTVIATYDTISGGTKDYTATVSLRVTQTPAAGAPVVISANDSEAGTSIKTAEKAISNDLVSLYSGGSGDTKVATIGATAVADDNSGLEFTQAFLPGGNGRDYTVTAKKNVKVTIYYTVCNGDIATSTTVVEKDGNLQWTLTPSGGTVGELQTSSETGKKSSQVAYSEVIELNAGDVLTLTASQNRPIIFGVAAVEA